MGDGFRRYDVGEHDGPVIDADFEVVGDEPLKTRTRPHATRSVDLRELVNAAGLGIVIGLTLAALGDPLSERD